ncbi:MAG: extensin family protein [Sphingobium sp.]
MKSCRWISLVALVLLAACVHGSQHLRSHGRPASARHNTSETFRQCITRLDLAGVRYTPLPDQHFGGGCDSIASVKLLDIGVPTANLGSMTCTLAANFAAWARYGVQPAARQILGSELVRIETMGTYSCRNIAGSSRISEHAHANAVDVSAFVLADGRRITVIDGWNGEEQSRRFLRVVRASACKRFKTVLSPDFNVAHSNHLHFDMGGAGGFCR